jgi:hypothetical protein
VIVCAGQAVPNVGKVCSVFKTLETAHQTAKHHIPTHKLLQKVCPKFLHKVKLLKKNAGITELTISIPESIPIVLPSLFVS